MRNTALFLILLFLSSSASAQQDTLSAVPIDSGELVLPVTELNGIRNFTYRVITQEYLNNENGYMLGVTVDTAFLKFSRTERPLVYKVVRSKSENKFVPVKSQDTFKKMELEIEFLPTGRVKELVNWKAFRDIFVSSSSAQARAGMITSEEFEVAKTKFNNEGYVRRLVMEDINYLFYLCGDTFNTAIEYLRLKAIRSPFSGYDYYFQGTLKLKRPEGSKNSMEFFAQNKAGGGEKPQLMNEAKAYLRSVTPEGEPVSEIKSVGLNSEQSFIYNMAQKRMMSVTLSDVVTLDMSARGNIRIFQFWDVVKD